jgi:hypothetical protein
MIYLYRNELEDQLNTIKKELGDQLNTIKKELEDQLNTIKLAMQAIEIPQFTLIHLNKSQPVSTKYSPPLNFQVA